VKDTTGKHYAILALNQNGKRLWSRTYTGMGEIMNLSELPDNRILVTGDQWRAKIDPKGYLIWETPANRTDSILATSVLHGGEILYFGLRNGNKQVIIKTGADNKTIWEKEITGTEVLKSVGSLVPGGPNQLIALCSFENGQAIQWINTMNGEIQRSVSLPPEIAFSGICLDMRNNLLLVGFTGELLVLKNSGITF
jgi:hypothetical protein